MNCPKCGEQFTDFPETDLRQEWRRKEYFCHNCDRTFTLLTVFKTQSSLVDSQEWEDYDVTKMDEYVFQLNLIAEGVNKDDAWNTLIRELDGFNLQELDDLNIESIKCHGNFV